jgi:hypothetical protein
MPLIGAGTGIDASADMVATARAGTPAELCGQGFLRGHGCRAAQASRRQLRPGTEPARPVYAAEIVRVLRPGGVFITQQVGGRTTQSIFSAFGWQSNAALWQNYYSAADTPAMPDEIHGLAALEAAFGRLGCTTRARAEYNARYWAQRP